MTLRVVTALTDRGLEADVVRRLSRADTGATVVRRCLDVVELRTVAGARLADVAVVDLTLRGLDRDAITELRAQGIRVIVTALSPDQAVAMGADQVVPEDAEQVLIALRSGSMRAAVHDRREGVGGRVVAVWGPIGAPGRTLVAVSLADELSRAGVQCILSDADTYGPSVAQQLGLLDDASGLAAVCRLAAQGRVQVDSLVAAAVSLPSGLRILTGIPRSERWDELRPAALDAVWQCAREAASFTVVDIGFCIEHDELAWFEPGITSRNQAAVATLAAADVLVAVSSADPVGLVRLLRELPVARALAPTARVEVVVNRVAKATTNEAEVRALIAEHAGEVHVTIVPDDPSSVAAAMRSGRTLAEVAPRAPSRRALQALAQRLGAAAIELAGGPTGRHTGRRRRRRAAGV